MRTHRHFEMMSFIKVVPSSKILNVGISSHHNKTENVPKKRASVITAVPSAYPANSRVPKIDEQNYILFIRKIASTDKTVYCHIFSYCCSLRSLVC